MSTGWWYVQNGSINFSYNGLASNENGWFMVQGGKVDFNYTGLVANEIRLVVCTEWKYQTLITPDWQRMSTAGGM